MRHGETCTDGVKRYIGQTDLPLSPRGRAQAEAWGRHLRPIPLAAIVSSDLTRARESAAIIAGRREIPLEVAPGLREISLGRWEKMAFSALREQAPGEFFKRGAAIDTHRPPGGESFLDLQRRAVAAFHRIVTDTLGDTDGQLLIVAHAGVNRVILCHLLEMPLANLFRLGQDSACLNTIHRRKDGYRILGVNQAPPCNDRSEAPEQCGPADPPK
jgi:probable phosphoglycerate mutase